MKVVVPTHSIPFMYNAWIVVLHTVAFSVHIDLKVMALTEKIVIAISSTWFLSPSIQYSCISNKEKHFFGGSTHWRAMMSDLWNFPSIIIHWRLSPFIFTFLCEFCGESLGSGGWGRSNLIRYTFTHCNKLASESCEGKKSVEVSGTTNCWGSSSSFSLHASCGNRLI